MTLTPLQKAQAWQKQLDKAVAAIVYEDVHSFIQATATAGKYEILLHGVTHATVIGSGSLEGCHRVAAKILKYPQSKKNLIVAAGGYGFDGHIEHDRKSKSERIKDRLEEFQSKKEGKS